MLQFVRMSLADDDRTDALLGSSLGLMGDIGDVYGAAAKSELLADWVAQSLSAGRSRGTSKSTRDSASYCRGVSQRFCISLVTDTIRSSSASRLSNQLAISIIFRPSVSV